MERWEEGFDSWTPAPDAPPPADPSAEIDVLKRTLREAAVRVAELQRELEAGVAALVAREAAVEARERALGVVPSLSDDLAARARTHAQAQTRS
jgi:hypothetical protein